MILSQCLQQPLESLGGRCFAPCNRHFPVLSGLKISYESADKVSMYGEIIQDSSYLSRRDILVRLFKNVEKLRKQQVFDM